jgi:hypothetical protein
MKLAIVLAVAACHSTNPGSPDAAISDATISHDAAAETIVVSMLRGTTPIVAAAVVSHDADGNVLATYATDANGDATILAAGVGMITAVDADDTQLYTAIGVTGGDHIVIPTFAIQPAYGTVAVTLPAAPPNAVAFQVFLGTDFGGGTSVVAPFAIAASALDVGVDGTITVIGLARDASYNIIAASVATSVTPPATGDTMSVTTGAWSTAIDEFHLGVTNGNLGALVNTTEGQIINGVEYDLPSLTGNNAYIRWWPVPTLGGYVAYSAQIPFGTGGAKRFQARRLPPDATSDAVDIDAQLPGLTGTTASSTDVARPTLAWSAAGSTASADGVLLNTRWNGSRYAQWAFLMPATQTSVRFPALPASLAMWVPDAPVAQPYAVLVDTTYDAGFAEFRADGFGLVSGPVFLHPGTGTLLGSTFFPQAF